MNSKLIRQTAVANSYTVFASRLTVYLGVAAILIGLMSFEGLKSANAQIAPLTMQMQYGSRGSQVTSLQTYLATMPSIYPQGLVTGYFGVLTRAAVIRFQAAHGIDQVGRVGPITLAKINSLLAGGLPTGDVSGPQFFNANLVNNSNTSVTFNWATNEQASGRVIYNTSPVMFAETESSLVPLNGSSVGGSLGSTQSVSITGLTPNTTYYYTLIATDAAGNISAFGPNLTFRTNP